MKHHSLPILIILFLAGCDRNPPETVVTPPVTVPLLQPFASYSLQPHVAEPSGIVYNPRNNSMFVVSDSHSDIVEVDLTGRKLRAVATVSSDLEGVALTGSGDTLYVAEEQKRKISAYTPAGTSLYSFSADVATLANNGLEGVSVGPGGHLFVLNEKAPTMLLEYTAAGTEVRRVTLTATSDLSGIMYDSGRQCLWIVSDEAKAVLRTGLDGSLQKRWALPFVKAEGIAIVRDTMYIVNDADGKMYLFAAPQ
ncbi:MAG: SdiA-regulated domain-containing protein [Bacteroidetes bacterium]|nr:SdiA-regulated domain-containing protein [Bacteroidota bacterium]